ncbi:MAG TPA: PhoX family phosphatase [Mycobacteriales bacterium]|nr:PhoX family phosphatase [Mycobacteriales bacterium]
MTELTDRVDVDPSGALDVDPDDFSSNPSTAPRFRDVVEARLSRRTVLQGGMLTAAAFLSTSLLDTPAAQGAPRSTSRGARPAAAPALLGYRPVPLSTADEVIVPAGYTAVPFIPWGTPLQPSGPGFRPGTAPFVPDGNTAAEQERQIGMHHDGMHYFPFGKGGDASRRGLLVVNHEYTDEDVLHTGEFSGDTGAWIAANRGRYTLDMVRKSQAAHGVAVVEVREDKRGRWKVMPSTYNRRVTANTPMTFSGPAAGSPLLDTGKPADGTNPVGTINNCSHGFTPWGTYLACEENFNGYFSRAAGDYGTNSALLTRYGVGGDRYNWTTHDSRFAVTPDRPNEPNRFGWVVEIDPFQPASTPVKRTALGRLKHEGAHVHETASGHVVVYMGDDQSDDYAYKFVSARPWRAMVMDGQSPLDHGTLYVARFDADGSGRWIPLVHGQNGLTAGNGFADQADVLVKTRLAADRVGATPMDRPEWTTVDPTTGLVYLTLTNNTGRKTPNGPNPRVLVEGAGQDLDGDGTPGEGRVGNPWGQIVRWQEHNGDHTATTFVWDLLLLAGQGAGSGDGSTIAAEDAFGSPDGLWADPDGRLWIQTDGRQPGGAHDQMLAAAPTALKPGQVADTPEIRRFLTGPIGAEVTGVITTPDQRTMFVNIQHPEASWPRVGGTTPRSSTVVVTKDDGGVIGT